jgi:multiple sugar transport system ATP-binding protein
VLGIEELLARKPRALSGGQRQRVALGRAIVREPRAFLFDEPLSNLDARLRLSTRAELKALHQRLRTTSIYVTHDQEEAMTLGDRIVVMSRGAIQQVDTPLNVFRRPANRFVAAFLGTPPMNFLEGRLVEAAGGLVFEENVAAADARPVRARVSDGHVPRLAAFTGQRVVMGLRPKSLRDAAAEGGGEPGADVWQCPVRVVEPLGDSMDVYCATGGQQIVARVPARAGLRAGDVALLKPEMDAAHFFEPGEMGKSLPGG